MDKKNYRKVVMIMIGLIILISAVSVAYIVLEIVKLKKAKYLLAPIISLLYGAMLFFVGMSVNSVLFSVLATIPVITVVIIIFKQNYTKKN